MATLESIVIATHNLSKKGRYIDIFSGIAQQILDLKDIGVSDKPDETGQTAEENAQIKAKFYSSKTDKPIFSEDESLFVDFLPPDQQPGVYVRRINGRDEVSDDELLKHWEEIIAQVPVNQRTGRWHFAYCLANLGNDLITFSLEYPLLFFSPSSKIRLPGWPMSSLEGAAIIGKPHAEFTDEENRRVNQSAINLIRQKLNEFLKTSS